MDEVRKFLMLWVMEFGEASITIEQRRSWYHDHRASLNGWVVNSEPVRCYFTPSRMTSAKINQKGLDLIRGENDEINN